MNHSDFCRTCAALRIIALLCWLAGVLWLSLAPSLPSPPELLSWDKLQHAGVYAMMTFLAGRVFILFTRSPFRGWLTAAAFAIAFGGAMEIAQGTLSEVRSAEWGDMLANVCGSATAFLGAFLWLRLEQRKQP